MDYYFDFKRNYFYNSIVSIKHKYCIVQTMTKLNSGIENRHNFFVGDIFLFQRLETDSVNQADSGDIKIFGQFHKNPI